MHLIVRKIWYFIVHRTTQKTLKYDTPVANDEYSKVQLEDGGKKGKGHCPCSNSEEVPQHLGDHGFVRHGQFVVTGVPQNLLVGGDHPGQRH